MIFAFERVDGSSTLFDLTVVSADSSAREA